MKLFILLLTLGPFSTFSQEENYTMKVIYELRGAAFFYQLDNEYYSQVLVGRNGGNWAILFKLNDDEKQKYMSHGFDYFHALDKSVASNIDDYSKRAIHGALAKDASNAIKQWRKSNPL